MRRLFVLARGARRKDPIVVGITASMIVLVACMMPLTLVSCSSDSGTTTTVKKGVTTTVTGGADGTTSTSGSPSDGAASTTTSGSQSVSTVGPPYYSALTGLPVAGEANLTRPVTGIMIDNHTLARPQSGIKDGEVIVEAIAEAGITRFLVLYQQNRPTLVGPVRSLRVYDIDWAVPFDCSIAHVGGAKSALQEVRNGRYRDIDMFLNGAYYWRSNDRGAPHNVYTNFDKMDSLNKKKGYTSSHPTGFSRVDGSPSGNPDATSIKVHISQGTYDSSYTYDKSTNAYVRYQGGKQYVDREKGPVAPSVVVALYVEEHRGNVEWGILRESIQTTGSGEGVIFQNGTATTVTWHKAQQSSQFTFTDAGGKDVPLARGQTWIVMVPKDGKVSWG